MQAKISYQKSEKGPVSIPECAADGKSIMLENSGRREENLGNWTIKRTVDGKDKLPFVLPSDFIIKPQTRARVWARGSKPSNAPSTDLESRESSWGIGSDITTKLVNPAGEDKASHVQKTTYNT
jgi:intermediate filament protein if